MTGNCELEYMLLLIKCKKCNVYNKNKNYNTFREIMDYFEDNCTECMDKFYKTLNEK